MAPPVEKPVLVLTKSAPASLDNKHALTFSSSVNKQVSMITDGQQVLHSLKRASPVLFLRQLIGFQVNKDKIVKKFGSENEEE